MHRTLKVLASCGVALVAGCGESSRISAELQNDLALASAGADIELASRSTDQTLIVGAVERTAPPSRAVASSARAPRPRRSTTPQVTADVQEETEIVQEPEVAAVEEPLPVPAPVEEAPVVIRGGSVGDDRCPPPRTRRRTPASINERFPPRGRGTGGVAMGGRTGGRQVVHTAPARPRGLPSGNPMADGARGAKPASGADYQ